MIEVELKARVRDMAAVESAVASFASLVGEVDKRDAYWRGPEAVAAAPARESAAPAPEAAAPGAVTAEPGAAAALPRRDFRLRREAGSSVVTFKDKRVEDGIEVNAEVEFGVDDPESFESLALRLGCSRWYEKRKRGRRYEVPSPAAAGGAATIELVEVEGLGGFVEIEILVEEGDPGAAADARSELRRLLAAAGVPEADIEGRFYSELLGKRER